MSTIAKHFAQGISAKIHKALRDGAETLFEPRVGSSGMSVEMFLSSLEGVYGKALLQQFDDPGAFLRMRQELMPHYRRMNLIQHFIKRSKMPSWFVRFDNQLRDLLWDAVRIARAAGRRSAGLPEVMAALCLDDELVARLKQKYGFMPVRFLEKLPAGPDHLSPDNTADPESGRSHPSGNI